MQRIKLTEHQHSELIKAFAVLKGILDTDLTQYVLLIKHEGHEAHTTTGNLLELAERLRESNRFMESVRPLLPALHVHFLAACTAIDQNLFVPAVKQLQQYPIEL